jgi:hypothetical protein
MSGEAGRGKSHPKERRVPHISPLRCGNRATHPWVPHVRRSRTWEVTPQRTPGAPHLAFEMWESRHRRRHPTPKPTSPAFASRYPKPSGLGLYASPWAKGALAPGARSRFALGKPCQPPNHPQNPPTPTNQTLSFFKIVGILVMPHPVQLNQDRKRTTYYVERTTHRAPPPQARPNPPGLRI